MERNFRRQIYHSAASLFGADHQLVVSVEELSELQKEICKYIRRKGDKAHLIEELADVRIVLEQIEILLGVDNDDICQVMDAKLERLVGTIEAELEQRQQLGEDFEW